jgi:protocatechuate 3,4-dioxygenase beta subunit
VYHRAWIKTDADGTYTFYTFIPGTIHRSGKLRHIHPVIKEPGMPEYDMDVFFFDNDPLLTKARRKKLTKADRMNSILNVVEKDGMFLATEILCLVKTQHSVDNLKPYKFNII